jgi:hypothetical protein
MPELIAAEFVEEIMEPFKREPSCSDIQAQYIQIVLIKAQGAGPNWIANIDLPMSDLAKMEAKAAIDEVRGTFALKRS